MCWCVCVCVWRCFNGIENSQHSSLSLPLSQNTCKQLGVSPDHTYYFGLFLVSVCVCVCVHAFLVCHHQQHVPHLPSSLCACLCVTMHLLLQSDLTRVVRTLHPFEVPLVSQDNDTNIQVGSAFFFFFFFFFFSLSVCVCVSVSVCVSVLHLAYWFSLSHVPAPSSHPPLLLLPLLLLLILLLLLLPLSSTPSPAILQLRKSYLHPIVERDLLDDPVALKLIYAQV